MYTKVLFETRLVKNFVRNSFVFKNKFSSSSKIFAVRARTYTCSARKLADTFTVETRRHIPERVRKYILKYNTIISKSLREQFILPDLSKLKTFFKYM